MAHIRKTFGSVAALDDVTLTVAPGELFCLLGPSGCGKSTLLGVIGGLTQPDAGRVRLGQADITTLPMQQRNIGIVFQSYALFPHLSVAENIAFGLRIRRVSRQEINRRTGELLDLTRLAGKEQRLPRQLSGGEQQRVAVARALAIQPRLLLLDEPFSNLDAKLRDDLRQELRRVQRATGVTTILVTHDQDEAFAMGDRVGLMRSGQLEQIGDPQDLYARPRTEFAARFIGESNILTDPTDSGGKVLIRPQHMHVCSSPPTSGPSLRGVIRDARYRGLGWMYVVAADETTLLAFVADGMPERFEVGAAVFVSWTASHALALP